MGPKNSDTLYPRITLGMIVKDEAHIIERCLNSVRDSIDYVIIHDTGSTDATHSIIGTFMIDKELEGAVSRVEWKDFGYNRARVLAECQDVGATEYTLMLDADETLEGDLKNAIERDFERSGYYCDTYQIEVRLGQTHYRRNFVFSNRRPWKFEGIVHEYPECSGGFTTGMLHGVKIISHHDGARSQDPDKYKNDVKLFQAIQDRDLTAREVFYYAQSLRDAEKTTEAAYWYSKRTHMGGYQEEIFYSYLMLGKLTDEVEYFLNAYEMRPKRMEPLYYLAKYHMNRGEWNTALLYLDPISFADIPADGLFVEVDIYNWKARMEMAVAYHYSGQYREAVAMNESLLQEGTDGYIPPQVIPQIKKNLDFSRKALNHD